MGLYSTGVIDDCFESSGDDEVVLRVHVQPGSGRSAMVGKHGNALKVRVAAPPVGGRANEALLALVAQTLGLKGEQVTLLSGESSRTKRVKITGLDTDGVRQLLDDAVAAGNAGPGRGVRRSAH
jgi:uncharacterized protein (TIGR00251 family)